MYAQVLGIRTGTSLRVIILPTTYSSGSGEWPLGYTGVCSRVLVILVVRP